MLRISSETGGKLACRRDRLLHSHGCEARSAEQPADGHPQHCRGRARPRQQVILLFPDIMRNSVIGGFDSQHDVSPIDLNLSLRAGYGRRPFPMALPKSVATLKWCRIVKISDSILADPTEKAVFGQGKSLLSFWRGLTTHCSSHEIPRIITPQTQPLSAHGCSASFRRAGGM